jgi:fused signal recognition particle receptor
LGLFQRLKSGLVKTRQAFTDRMRDVLGRRRIDEEVYEDLEDILLAADLGVTTTEALLKLLVKEAKRKKLETADQLIPLLRELILQTFTIDKASEPSQPTVSRGLQVILVVGVNGVGKTTTIGKLASHYKSSGKKVLIAAGDTFRAAAIEQLTVWGERAGVEVIRQNQGADAAAVIFDGIQAAKARDADLLICDTAGRLQNKAHLMEELEKIHRIIHREVPDGELEVLLVLDATTGQNAIVQAKMFNEAAKLSGIVLTKLDGTAKGGVVIAIYQELKIPIQWVGVGEGIDDLQPFAASDFVEALFSQA